MYLTRFASVFRMMMLLATVFCVSVSARLNVPVVSHPIVIVQTLQNSPASRIRNLNINLFGKTLNLKLDVGTLGFIVIIALTGLSLTAILLALFARRRARQAEVANRKLQEEVGQRKHAEEEVLRLNSLLEVRVAERTAQLQAVNEELEAFSYSVSHDLRAPLRHINGFSQALQEDYADKLDEEGKGYLQQVRSASQEMAQLIDDVLQLARVTRSEMHREVVNLSEVAQAVITEIREEDHGRTAIINIEAGLSTYGDKRLLRIALNNLLGNAWKFTSKLKTAEISFGREQQNGEAIYFVRDNGAGFDMTYAAKLFSAFQRLHTALEFEGTGIGLATVQRIVHRHGGSVRAEGALDQGAVFYFTLPNFKEIEDEDDLTIVPRLPGGRTLTILSQRPAV
jgi:signal transduction histidine kinase